MKEPVVVSYQEESTSVKTPVIFNRYSAAIEFVGAIMKMNNISEITIREFREKRKAQIEE